AALGARHLTGVRRSESGAPSLRSAFDLVRQVSQAPILGYVNADIILLDDFLPAVSEVAQQLKRFLLAGQRWDLDVRDPIAFEPGWQQRMREEITRSGSLHRPVGSDYFVFPADLFPNLPDFTLGRSGWDNWMLFEARHRSIPLIDASRRITAIHQNHDYAHLPGGRPHHRHPESLRNLQLAGGREVIFRLEDADWRLEPQGLFPKRWRDWRYPRRWEADLIARFGPGRLSKWVRMAFRPGKTLRYLLGARRSVAAPGTVADESSSQVGIEE
ncbi:MAG TPA: hypothetical protein VFI11_12885, partial [Anaerolineales bacterium]|nr:hypothetical protein [Anaerolineales bacterium]